MSPCSSSSSPTTGRTFSGSEEEVDWIVMMLGSGDGMGPLTLSTPPSPSSLCCWRSGEGGCSALTSLTSFLRAGFGNTLGGGGFLCVCVWVCVCACVVSPSEAVYSVSTSLEHRRSWNGSSWNRSSWNGSRCLLLGDWLTADCQSSLFI